MVGMPPPPVSKMRMSCSPTAFCFRRTFLFVANFTLLIRDPRWKDIPFLFLTGYTNEVAKLDFLRSGVDEYLTKPFEPFDLLEKINHLLLKQQPAAPSPVIDKPSTENTYDSMWMNSLNELINSNLENRSLNLDFLSNEMAIGKRQLTRKVKKITGLSPAKYIEEIKLQFARKLLEEKEYFSVSEVCYSSGFNTPKYFAKRYKSRFGRLPSSYFK